MSTPVRDTAAVRPTSTATEVSDVAALRELVGEPQPRVRDKGRDRLSDVHRAFLAATRFCTLATADAEGRPTVSPKGDPAGSLVHVVSDTTIALAERPGNRRVDGYRNILVNPHVGLCFVVPGRGDTLRIDGTARILRDAPYADAFVVRDTRPILILEIEIRTTFFHCSKAFLRSQLWKPETWRPDDAPSRPQIAKTLERPDDSMAELEAYYDEASYSRGLY